MVAYFNWIFLLSCYSSWISEFSLVKIAKKVSTRVTLIINHLSLHLLLKTSIDILVLVKIQSKECNTATYPTFYYSYRLLFLKQLFLTVTVIQRSSSGVSRRQEWNFHVEDIVNIKTSRDILFFRRNFGKLQTLSGFGVSNDFL